MSRWDYWGNSYFVDLNLFNKKTVVLHRETSVRIKDRGLYIILISMVFLGLPKGCAKEEGLGIDQAIRITLENRIEQEGRPGELLPGPLVFRVSDSDGEPIPDQPLQIVVSDGGGELVVRAYRYQAAQLPSLETMHGPTGDSGRHAVANSWQSPGSSRPWITSPQRQPGGSTSAPGEISKRRQASNRA